MDDTPLPITYREIILVSMMMDKIFEQLKTGNNKSVNMLSNIDKENGINCQK
jgi:hypothetical protein